MGDSKLKVIKILGNPIRTLDNKQDGEILVYADQEIVGDGSKMVATNYWRYYYVYISKEGKVTSTRQERQNYPPQSIDSVKIEGLHLLTSK